uniref:Putative secreted protein n=1 Tax=Amblyomma cajennense TaxID=34607 RepID=A0A023FDZ4_AMBCJ
MTCLFSLTVFVSCFAKLLDTDVWSIVWFSPVVFAALLPATACKGINVSKMFGNLNKLASTLYIPLSSSWPPVHQGDLYRPISVQNRLGTCNKCCPFFVRCTELNGIRGFRLRALTI